LCLHLLHTIWKRDVYLSVAFWFVWASRCVHVCLCV
jgi:hypothetical protein